MAHLNVSVLNDGFTAFAAGDMQALGALFTDDVVWHTGGRGRFSGDYDGKGAVFTYFGEFVSDMDSFTQELHSVLADDEHGVAQVVGTATRGDDRLDFKNVLVFHFRDSRICECWVVPMDPYAADEFWA